MEPSQTTMDTIQTETPSEIQTQEGNLDPQEQLEPKLETKEPNQDPTLGKQEPSVPDTTEDKQEPTTTRPESKLQQSGSNTTGDVDSDGDNTSPKAMSTPLPKPHGQTRDDPFDDSFLPDEVLVRALSNDPEQQRISEEEQKSKEMETGKRTITQRKLVKDREYGLLKFVTFEKDLNKTGTLSDDSSGTDPFFSDLEDSEPDKETGEKHIKEPKTKETSLKEIGIMVKDMPRQARQTLDPILTTPYTQIMDTVERAEKAKQASKAHKDITGKVISQSLDDTAPLSQTMDDSGPITQSTIETPSTTMDHPQEKTATTGYTNMQANGTTTLTIKPLPGGKSRLPIGKPDNTKQTLQQTPYLPRNPTNWKVNPTNTNNLQEENTIIFGKTTKGEVNTFTLDKTEPWHPPSTGKSQNMTPFQFGTQSNGSIPNTPRAPNITTRTQRPLRPMTQPAQEPLRISTDNFQWRANGTYSNPLDSSRLKSHIRDQRTDTIVVGEPPTVEPLTPTEVTNIVQNATSEVMKEWMKVVKQELIASRLESRMDKEQLRAEVEHYFTRGRMSTPSDQSTTQTHNHIPGTTNISPLEHTGKRNMKDKVKKESTTQTGDSIHMPRTPKEPPDYNTSDYETDSDPERDNRHKHPPKIRKKSPPDDILDTSIPFVTQKDPLADWDDSIVTHDSHSGRSSMETKKLAKEVTHIGDQVEEMKHNMEVLLEMTRTNKSSPDTPKDTKPIRSQTDAPPPVCPFCGSPDHTWIECPEKDKENEDYRRNKQNNNNPPPSRQNSTPPPP